MSAGKLSADKQAPVSELRKRVNAEIQDNFDEDIELELEDSELAELLVGERTSPIARLLAAPALFQGAFAAAA